MASQRKVRLQSSRSKSSHRKTWHGCENACNLSALGSGDTDFWAWLVRQLDWILVQRKNQSSGNNVGNSRTGHWCSLLCVLLCPTQLSPGNMTQIAREWGKERHTDVYRIAGMRQAVHGQTQRHTYRMARMRQTVHALVGEAPTL